MFKGKTSVNEGPPQKATKLSSPQTRSNGIAKISPNKETKVSPKQNKTKEVLEKKRLLDNMVAQIVNSKAVSPGTRQIKSPSTPKNNPKRRLTTTPGSSAKKVNINLNLNKSQEISEHYSQLKKSPGIPWDASKKPAKPLLKPFIQSPINPFYKRKHNIK